MNRDVFLSILAMDSYNRGYNSGVDLRLGANSDAVGTRLGAATVTANRGQPDAQAAGFYAIAYDYEGETVIAFRGTDPTDGANIVRDLVNGWSTFSGMGTNTDSPRRTVH